jgi:hypothetical protein
MYGTILCLACKQQFGVRLNVEEQSLTDPGFAEIHDRADLSEVCEHVREGGEYEVVEVDMDDDYE